MDEDVGVGVGPAERAPHAGGGGPTPTRRRRMSAGRRREAGLRLLRGEDLELVSRELGVTAAELSGWREAFLAAGEASLRSRPADARDAEIGRLKAKVGELTMANELLGAKIGQLEAGRPLARRRSRRWAARSRPPRIIPTARIPDVLSRAEPRGARRGRSVVGRRHGRARMTIAVTRRELDAGGLRREAARCRDARAARRMLALALVLEGASREEAARAAGMDRQTLACMDGPRSAR